MSNMNLPNKISIARAGFIPVIIVLLYCRTNFTRALALIIFVISCISDFIDGYYARKHNLVTDFGKFIDPVADKLLVISTMLMLVELRELSAIVVIIVIIRELSVDGLRLVAMSSKTKKVIAASKLGKIKTTLQMIAVSLYLARPIGINIANQAVMALAVIFTIISGVDYFIKSKSILSVKKTSKKSSNN